MSAFFGREPAEDGLPSTAPESSCAGMTARDHPRLDPGRLSVVQPSLSLCHRDVDASPSTVNV
jgi:hypothetical protein